MVNDGPDPQGPDEGDDLITRVVAGKQVAVLGHKRSGIGLPHDTLSAGEASFLGRALRRLRCRVVPELLDPELEAASEAVRLPVLPGRRPRSGWRALAEETNLHAHVVRAADLVKYFIAQVVSLDVRIWPADNDALFFAACQLAVHQAYHNEFKNTEPDYTRSLWRVFPDVIENYVIDILRRNGGEPPNGIFLHFATAWMGVGKDLQGSDLAFVVGTKLHGKPVWRVVLVQAKREKARGYADVSYKDGAQLAEILATGMGFYLFYPIVHCGKSFIPTVRLAEDVFEKIHDPASPESIDAVESCGGGGTAWDLASFVALEMTRPETFGIGRIFQSVEAVADALSLGRKGPLEAVGTKARRPAYLFVASTSPDLDVLEFRPLLEQDYGNFKFFGTSDAASPSPVP